MTEYTIVIEDAGSNYGAYVIGLDGCITTGKIVEETVENMKVAIAFHLEGMKLHGDELPEHPPIVTTISVAS